MLAAVFCPTTKKRQMIKANEIRIGNFITDPEFPNIPSIVDEIQNDGFIVTTFNDHLTNILATPIELTEQWVIDFGLSIDNWFCDESFLVVKDEDLGFALKTRNASHTKEIEVAYFKYVHQFQNLVFVLTGFELSVVANGS